MNTLLLIYVPFSSVNFEVCMQKKKKNVGRKGQTSHMNVQFLHCFCVVLRLKAFSVLLSQIWSVENGGLFIIFQIYILSSPGVGGLYVFKCVILNLFEKNIIKASFVLSYQYRNALLLVIPRVHKRTFVKIIY